MLGTRIWARGGCTAQLSTVDKHKSPSHMVLYINPQISKFLRAFVNVFGGYDANDILIHIRML